MRSDYTDGEQLPVERTLTVINYDESKGKVIKKRITFAPHNIDFVVASFESYMVVEGQEVYRANVIMTSGANLEVYVTLLDLMSIERAAGTYFLP